MWFRSACATTSCFISAGMSLRFLTSKLVILTTAKRWQNFFGHGVLTMTMETINRFGYEALVTVWIARNGVRLHSNHTFQAASLKGICRLIHEQSQTLRRPVGDEGEIFRCPVINVSLWGKHQGFYRWHQSFSKFDRLPIHAFGKLTKLHWKFQNRGVIPEEFAERLRHKELYEIDHIDWAFDKMTSGKRQMYNLHKYQDAIPHICRPPVRDNIFC